jgi:hypothetical protein
MMSEDPYEETHQLINMLLSLGEDSWASRLRTAMSTGSVGTEILGATRMVLREFEDSGIPVDKGLSQRVTAICTQITVILERSGFR